MYLAIAPNQTIGQMWVTLLENNGIPSMIKGGGVPSYLGVGILPCQVMVHEEDLDEASDMVPPRSGTEPDLTA